MRDIQFAHIGFKDVGVDPPTPGRLAERIPALGATSYPEVVSASPVARLAAVRAAIQIGVDRGRDGTQLERTPGGPPPPRSPVASSQGAPRAT